LASGQDALNILIDPFTVHDLRRTGSTRLHEAGFALNHTIGGVRGIYNRAEYASQRREMLHSGRTTWTPWRTKRK